MPLWADSTDLYLRINLGYDSVILQILARIKIGQIRPKVFYPS